MVRTYWTRATFWHNPLFAVGGQLPYWGGHQIKKLKTEPYGKHHQHPVASTVWKCIAGGKAQLI